MTFPEIIKISNLVSNILKLYFTTFSRLLQTETGNTHVGPLGLVRRSLVSSLTITPPHLTNVKNIPVFLRRPYPLK